MDPHIISALALLGIQLRIMYQLGRVETRLTQLEQLLPAKRAQ